MPNYAVIDIIHEVYETHALLGSCQLPFQNQITVSSHCLLVPISVSLWSLFLLAILVPGMTHLNCSCVVMPVSFGITL